VGAPARRLDDLRGLSRRGIDKGRGLPVRRRGDLLVFDRDHRRDQPIAAARDVRDIDRILLVIAECAAQPGDGLVDRIMRDDNVLPDRIEELFDADDPASVLREANKDPHRARLKLRSYAASRNLIERRFYAPGTNSKGCTIRRDHRLVT
jgi:hypothetical protein